MRLAPAMFLLALSAAAAATPVQQQLGAEVDAALLRLADRGALPEAGVPITIERPAQTRHELGAVVDVRAGGADGLPVLAVSPGGAAERIGLKAGDRLLALNARRFDGSAPAADALQAALREGDGTLRVEVAREGRTLALSGRADTVTLPAYRLSVGDAGGGGAAAPADGCGRISTFDVAPRSRQLYAAVLIAIDGETPGPSTSEVFRVSAGRHTLTVAEKIDWRQFSDLQRFQRDRGGRDRYKQIELDVQPDTTYLLGARLVLDQRNSIRDGAYWEPAIWKESAERCR